ncbi:putative alpha,alpha-trehalose-phosphate synthase (UDP-forming) [Helianthus annuus]|nr:putative alpha,alpha-trehalose-phosphate synthase (UDP-forming) [Helianthus annuus]
MLLASQIEASKGLVAEKIFTSMAESGKQADFVLCIGDDRSDEDMFEIIAMQSQETCCLSILTSLPAPLDRSPAKRNITWMTRARLY